METRNAAHAGVYVLMGYRTLVDRLVLDAQEQAVAAEERPMVGIHRDGSAGG